MTSDSSSSSSSSVTPVEKLSWDNILSHPSVNHYIRYVTVITACEDGWTIPYIIPESLWDERIEKEYQATKDENNKDPYPSKFIDALSQILYEDSSVLHFNDQFQELPLEWTKNNPRVIFVPCWC